jgi:hypothetical protein
MLVAEGVMTKADDPSHKQKAIYSLTEKAITLVPVFAHIGAWGRRHLPASDELSIRAELLEAGGPAMWDQFMHELREEHLRAPAQGSLGRTGASVRATLQAGYERVVARRERAVAATGKPRSPRRTGGER